MRAFFFGLTEANERQRTRDINIKQKSPQSRAVTDDANRQVQKSASTLVRQGAQAETRGSAAASSPA
jgi:hypothetical protein